MKKLALFAAVLCAVFAVAWNAYGGWGSAGCGPVGSFVQMQANTGYEWRPIAGDTDSISLWYGGRQVGAYRYSTGFYHELVGGVMSRPKRAPVRPPLEGAGGETKGYIFGLDSSYKGHESRAWTGDRMVSEVEIPNLITGGVVDDSKAPHVTVFSKTVADAHKAVSAWEAAKPKIAGGDKVRFQSYDVSNPINQQMLPAFKLDQDKTLQETGSVIVAQLAPSEPGGKSRVIDHRPFTGIESLVDAVRTVDPNYDPNKDKWPKWPGFDVVPVEVVVIVVLFFVVCVCLAAGRKQ